MTAKMDNWDTSESLKSVIRITTIGADYQQKEIVFSAQCSLNTVKMIQNEVKWCCSGDYETVSTRKQNKKRSDCTCSAEFLETPRPNV